MSKEITPKKPIDYPKHITEYHEFYALGRIESIVQFESMYENPINAIKEVLAELKYMRGL